MAPLARLGGKGKTARSYTDAFGKTLRETLHNTVLDAARGQADRVGDRAPAGVAVGDHRQAAQPEQIGAAVCVRIEAGTQAARRRPDQQAAELAGPRRRDLLPQRVEQLADRALEQLERDVAGESVGDDD